MASEASSNSNSFSYYERPEAYIGAIDQGTSSSRFLVFSSRSGEILCQSQIELQHISQHEGWLEIDAQAILDSVAECMRDGVSKFTELGFDANLIRAVGVTNQRETAVMWDRVTGKALYNAIVWCDMRTSDLAEKYVARTASKSKDAFRTKCGLPIHPYFSALKFRWLIDNVSAVQDALDENRLMAGTVDSFLIWHLSAGVRHVTDVSNASRTMLMNLRSLKWDDKLCRFFDIPQNILPEIRSSSEIYAYISADYALAGVPIAGCLGDQQAALLGHSCVEAGMAKNTYGTGCFLLYCTGNKAVYSRHGLLTTVAFRLGPDRKAVYALEGSIATAGLVVRWLRDNLGLLSSAAEIESLAAQVDSTHGVCFVPAFSGLYAPHWHPEARGLICGITNYTTKAHVARAALEGVCLQTVEIIDAMRADCGVELNCLKVDGGMTTNDLFMQMQADLLGTVVDRPQMTEMTALGAAVAAGMAMGIWNVEGLRRKPPKSDRFRPSMSYEDRRRKVRRWKAAVKRSMYWTTPHGEVPVQKPERSWWNAAGPLLGVALGAAALLIVQRYGNSIMTRLKL